MKPLTRTLAKSMKEIKKFGILASLAVLLIVAAAFFKDPGQIPPATYTCGVSAVSAATAPTDIMTITGSASKLVKITRFEMYATQTTAAVVTVNLIRRSTADTSGTFVQDGMNPYDLTDDPSTVTCGHYTANPTLGTTLTTLGNYRPMIPTTAGIPTGDLIESFGDGVEPITLRGVSDILVVNLGGATTTGLAFTIQIEYTEQ